jgi:uncharacterized protein YceK
MAMKKVVIALIVLAVVAVGCGAVDKVTYDAKQVMAEAVTSQVAANSNAGLQSPRPAGEVPTAAPVVVYVEPTAVYVAPTVAPAQPASVPVIGSIVIEDNSNAGGTCVPTSPTEPCEVQP